MPETQIAVTERDVGKYVGDTLPALIKAYSARSYDGNAFLKTAALAIVESKELMACLATEAGRISLKHALRFAATTGLSLNPQEGKACLVPKGGKIQYWPMKNGLVDLVLDTGVVKYVRMNAVHDKDGFHLTSTMNGDDYTFSPGLRGRGEIIGFFCAIKLKSGESLVEYMPRGEVEEHRKKYSEKTAMTFEDYGIKTVTKRATKRAALPNATALEAAVEMGEAEPVTFEETPAPSGKGASAADVEAKLKARTETPEAEKEIVGLVDGAGSQPAATVRTGASSDSPAPVVVEAGAQGSATEQPELGLPGGAPKDIF